jgi:hypothetical protein
MLLGAALCCMSHLPLGTDQGRGPRGMGSGDLWACLHGGGLERGP